MRKIKDKRKLYWIICGGIALSLFPYIIEALFGHLVTMPIYFLILMLSFDSFVSFLIFPLIYAIFTYFLASSEKFGKVILTFGIVVLSLNFFYILQSVSTGLQYWGNVHTITVIIINIMSSLSVIGLAYVGLIKKSTNMQYAANLILFFMLSWCAFPFLGEP